MEQVIAQHSPSVRQVRENNGEQAVYSWPGHHVESKVYLLRLLREHECAPDGDWSILTI